ncbi:MAG: inner membrane CreD family protein, partial [Rubricella sp.]
MANRFSSRGWRFFIMAVLALLMMIPLLLVQGVVWDRENYYEQALREVGAAWGGPQTIGVPTLFVTTERQIEQTIPANGEQPERTELRTLSDVIALTPEETAISASIETEMRQRGIFEVPVFRARVTMFSRFEPDRIDTVIADGERILWQTARIGVSVRETRGLREAVAISNGRTLDVEPGFAGQGEGFSVPITRSALAEPLEIAFTLNGAESIALQPGGRDSRLEVTSTWPDPSFGGG